MNKVIIYSLTDPRDNKIKYVGKTNNMKRRFREHIKEDGKYKKVRWIQKLIKLNLKPIMLELDEILETEQDFWEEHWISLVKSWGFNLLNHTKGGTNPPIVRKFGKDNSFKITHVAAMVLEMNLARKDKTYEELYGEERAKQLKEDISKRTSGENNPMYDKQHADETKIKISLANSGENNGNYGKHLSPEHIEILRVYNTNKVVSEETKEKQRIIALNRPPVSQETKDKLKLIHRKEGNGNFKGVVYQYTKDHELVKTWRGLFEIKEIHGRKYTNICSCITGATKTAYGYIWTRILL